MTKSTLMKPRELAELIYSQLDGRAKLAQSVKKLPQHEMMDQLSLPTRFWRNKNFDYASM